MRKDLQAFFEGCKVIFERRADAFINVWNIFHVKLVRFIERYHTVIQLDVFVGQRRVLDLNQFPV
jgi:hypothetical protein